MNLIPYGHQPRITYDKQSPFTVNSPEVSQAFYGKLRGEAEEYIITPPTDKPAFKLNVELLVPDIPSSKLDYTVIITDSRDNIIGKINPGATGKFNEPYSNTQYLQGGNFAKVVPTDTYRVKVSNPTNTGKYVLAIGDLEEFPPEEIANASILIPQLKRKYFTEDGVVKPNKKVNWWLWIIVITLLMTFLYYKKNT